MIYRDIRKLVRHGRSLYVSIPKKLCTLMGLRKGDKVVIEVDDSGQDVILIAIKPIRKMKVKKERKR